MLTISACGGGGTQTADWWLVRTPTPDQRSLTLMVHERACASGASAKGRVEPEVTYNPDSIIVTIRMANRDGSFRSLAQDSELRLDDDLGTGR